METESGDWRLDGALEHRRVKGNEEHPDEQERRSEKALADVFEHYRSRLERMVECRIDPHLRAHLSAHDVVQEVYLVARSRLEEFLKERRMPFYLWLRFITGQKLIDLHRRYMARKRGADREVSLERGGCSDRSSIIMADRLVKTTATPSRIIMKEETRAKLKEALDSLEAADREILLLRHFEELSNAEAAEVLGLTEAAASQRHARALKRLREVLQRVEGFESATL